jgi:rubrerythrin
LSFRPKKKAFSKSTKENLREAITGETHEFKEMYPEMIAAAKEEGAKWRMNKAQKIYSIRTVCSL